MIVVTGTSRSGHHFVINVIRSWGLEVWKSENREPVYRYGKGKRHLVNTAGAVHVIQTRDFLNWLASWMMMAIPREVDDKEICRLIDVWLTNSKEYFNGGSIPLLYDRFVGSEEYRRNICKQVGGTYNEDELNTVPRAGKGSSFDGSDFNGRGSEMDVLNRWVWFYGEGQKYEPYIYRNREALSHYVNNYPKTEQLEYAKLLLG
jgi:hypothetical protein